jgi:excisionase family DNA binding protein
MSSHNNSADLDKPLTRREADELYRLLEKFFYQSAPTPARYLTVDETAERLGISRASLYRLFEAGKIRRQWFGRSVRVLEADLENLNTKGKK